MASVHAQHVGSLLGLPPDVQLVGTTAVSDNRPINSSGCSDSLYVDA
jgi:hypothetical protein